MISFEGDFKAKMQSTTMLLQCVIFTLALNTGFALIQYNDGIVTCDRYQWMKRGCYDEDVINKDNMLVNWRYDIKWDAQGFKDFITKLTCTCAEEARAANSSGFALFWWGQCFSIPYEEITALRDGDKEDTCYKGDGTYKKCTDGDDEEMLCIGDDNAVYLYSIQPIAGGFGEWNTWSTCSADCGSGVRSRQRKCDSPKPDPGGAPCEGPDTQEESCNTQVCVQLSAGVYGPWGGWSSCSKSCDGGLRNRTRMCFGGSPCVGPDFQTDECAIDNCPVNGGFGAWNEWTTCYQTCGGGTQQRSRDCNNPSPSFGGDDCVGEASGVQLCNTQLCPTNGGFSDWTSWTVCSAKCGGGEKTRSQTCLHPSSCGEKKREESLKCNPQPCPIDGGVGNWTSWTNCSAVCGNGTRSRRRFCNSPTPLNGGKNCTESLYEALTCKGNACPVDGQWNSWSNWTSCDTHSICQCGKGTQERTRSCDKPVQVDGGKPCLGSGRQVKKCEIHNCACGYVCTVPLHDRVECGPANQTKEECHHHKFSCYDSERKTCYKGIVLTREYEWAEWGTWSKCGGECKHGRQLRKRACAPIKEDEEDDIEEEYADPFFRNWIKKTKTKISSGFRKVKSKIGSSLKSIKSRVGRFHKNVKSKFGKFGKRIGSKTSSLHRRVKSNMRVLGRGISRRFEWWHKYLRNRHNHKALTPDAQKGHKSKITPRGWGWGWLRLTRGKKCRGSNLGIRKCSFKCTTILDKCSLKNSYTYFKNGVISKRGYSDKHVIKKLGKEYEISFSFKPRSTTRGTILHIRSRRTLRHSWLGRNMPHVSVYGKTLRLALPVAGRKRNVYFKGAIYPGRTYRVAIKQVKKNGRYDVVVTMSGSRIRRFYVRVLKNSRPKDFYDVKVYATPGWQRAADAQVKDLTIKGICKS